MDLRIKITIAPLRTIAPLILLLIFCPNLIKGQETGIGASALYNFQTNGFGLGLRVPLKTQDQVSYTPQLAYYPSFNKVSEYVLGLAFEYKFIRWSNTDLYTILHGGYDNWINASKSVMKGATVSNWDGELGLGLAGRNCLKPFVEYRYNLRFQETHIQLGLIYVFGCGHSHIDRCPAYQ